MDTYSESDSGVILSSAERNNYSEIRTIRLQW